jgi:hypothetical protein
MPSARVETRAVSSCNRKFPPRTKRATCRGMSLTTLVKPQVVLEGPFIALDFIAENIRSGVISPLDGV